MTGNADNGKISLVCAYACNIIAYSLIVLVYTVSPKACHDLTCANYSTNAHLLETRGVCYWHLDGSWNREEAAIQCEKNNGHLATVYDQESHLFVVDEVFSEGCKIAWLGVHCKEQENSWVTWDRKPITWTRWASEFPRRSEARECVTFGRECYWRNRECSGGDLYGALCETEAKRTKPTTATQASMTTVLDSRQKEPSSGEDTTDTPSKSTVNQKTRNRPIYPETVFCTMAFGSCESAKSEISSITEGMSNFCRASSTPISSETAKPLLSPRICERRRRKSSDLTSMHTLAQLPNLRLDKRKTKKFLRRFHSASDDRQSSKSMGHFGVGVICVLWLLLLVLDIIGFIERRNQTTVAPDTDFKT